MSVLVFTRILKEKLVLKAENLSPEKKNATGEEKVMAVANSGHCWKSVKTAFIWSNISLQHSCNLQFDSLFSELGQMHISLCANSVDGHYKLVYVKLTFLGLKSTSNNLVEISPSQYIPVQSESTEI